MFLKSLDVFGFKSFADKTHIEFANGITALLGPNGCGKSNVVDAVKWVLGEQASKAMRAEKMEDVIFNGTENRKALNVAEAVLTLANDMGLLPLDVPEIEIKRRLYRSGESEYFINSAPVRLKEVRELFWDTGVGKTAYSVMEQGKIDQILSSKPDERRYLFEEAAGITRYKLKGAEAQRKLVKTEENIHQVELILAEVKRSYDTLRIQSEKTLKYRKLKDEIFEFELDIQLLKLKNFRYEQKEREGNLSKKTNERDALKAEMDAASKTLEENMDMVNSLELRLAEHQKIIYGLAVEKTAREKEVRLLSEQKGDTKVKIAQNEGRERGINIKIEELTRDAEEQDKVIASLRKNVADMEQNIASFEENIKIASSRMEENDNLLEKAEEDIHNFDRERAVHEKDLEAITDDIVTALDAGLKEAGYSAAERRNTEGTLDETLKFLKTILDGREKLLNDLADAAERDSAGKELKHITTNLHSALKEASAYADKAISLFESYRKSTPAFLDDFLAPEGIITKKRELDQKIRECRNGVIVKRAQISELRENNEILDTEIDEYRTTLEELRLNRMKMATQAEAAEEQARLIRRELSGQQGHLQAIQEELANDHKRETEIEDRIKLVENEIVEADKKSRQLSEDLEKIEKDITAKTGDVAGNQEIIKKRMAELARIQESMERLHIDLIQSETEIRNIQENFRETHSRDLMEFEERTFKITKPSAELREKLISQKEALKALGQVNFAAPEEFTETKERYDFLSSQLADLSKAREDLENLGSEIRMESSELFLESYNKIKRNFHNMFRRLFGGGRAELRLSDSNHVLESGIEIYAQPPGKKLENINLLSGGERSMTAVALLFATYMVKPSPFCLLDEIDAALDEQNVNRFVQLLREFGSVSQFIVITHNKKTVTGASTLLGVTMEESGITKIISVRLQGEDKEKRITESEDQPGLFEEEDVDYEDGRELPEGINDPSKVSEAEMHPIRKRSG